MTTVIQQILDTRCDGEQARTLAAAKSLIEQQRSLLREYMEVALQKREIWDIREGDEADEMSRRWQQKINQLHAVLAA